MRYNKTKEKKFRFSGKNVFLTYPQCDIPLETVLDQLNDKLAPIAVIKKWIISAEEHKDGGAHRHCWLELSTSPDYQDPSLFHLVGPNKTFKGNYQSMKFIDNCAKYVMKDGQFISNIPMEELENMKKHAGKPNAKFDKGLIARQIMDGRKLEELLIVYPALFFDLKKIQECIKIYKALMADIKPRDIMDNTWIWGPPGAGKSRSIQESYPGCYSKNKEEFWDGYEYEKVVIVEDVDHHWGPVLNNFKVWFDHYPWMAKIKHCNPIKIRPEKMFVTSNYTIRETLERYYKMFKFDHDEEMIIAMERRFNQVYMPGQGQCKPDDWPAGYFAEDKPSLSFDDMFDIGIDNHISYDKPVFDF